MSGGIRCFFVSNGAEGVDLAVAASKYDEVYCGGCSNNHDCRSMIEGIKEKPVEEADFRYREKIDNEGPE